LQKDYDEIVENTKAQKAENENLKKENADITSKLNSLTSENKELQEKYEEGKGSIEGLQKQL